MNQMPLEQQKHFLDFMEEGWSTNNKYVIHAHITGNTSLVASANPRNVQWRHPETIELDEINILTQIIHRFDIICILRETIPNEEADRQYIAAINEIKRKNKTGAFLGYESFLKKYLMYARTFNPDAKISEDASNMLDEYWIKMSQRGTKGRYRKLEGIKRIAVAISKLKLKNEVDTEDATDAMQFYNVIFMHFSQIAPVSQRPKELLYESCINIIRQHSPTPIASKELYRLASERNEQIKSYVGDNLNIETNWKLRTVHDELLNNEHVMLVKEKPAVFQWKSEHQPDDNDQREQTMVKADKQASDVSDVYEAPRDAAANENVVQQSTPTPSDTSYTSDSTYTNLIETKYLPNLGRTLYWCKEHPDTSEYYDLAGLEEIHFKPYHG
jgi:DNA replicative helicase MCM subunit Mcm2 (Cdc46/Mcm family)